MTRLTAMKLSRIVFLIPLAVGAGCDRKSASGSDPRLPVLQEQTRMMMIVEAQQGFIELFKNKFDPEKAQLLIGEELKKKLEEQRKSLNLIPEEIKTAIANNQGAALLISDAPTGKNGAPQTVVYLRPPRFGVRRFFLRLNEDPCGDGNPATCEFCSGCSGESEPGGIIKTCVCTESCSDCRSCPTC